jgi:hypothetical protein
MNWASTLSLAAAKLRRRYGVKELDVPTTAWVVMGLVAGENQRDSLFSSGYNALVPGDWSWPMLANAASYLCCGGTCHVGL